MFGGGYGGIVLEERRVWEFYRGIVREDGIDV